MSIRFTAWIAWSLCLLCVALAVASLILALLNGRTLAVIFLDWSSGPSIAALPTWTVSFSVVGALIASHRPENSIGWIFLAVGFCYGLVITADEYAIYALLTNPGALPLGAEASWRGQWIWAPGLGLILVFLPLLFPDGHPPSHRWRPVAWLGGLSIGLTVVSSMILLWPERGSALLTGDESPSHVSLEVRPKIFTSSSIVIRTRIGPGNVLWFLVETETHVGSFSGVETYSKNSSIGRSIVMVFSTCIAHPPSQPPRSPARRTSSQMMPPS
jgi:hypothetical protein